MAFGSRQPRCNISVALPAAFTLMDGGNKAFAVLTLCGSSLAPAQVYGFLPRQLSQHRQTESTVFHLWKQPRPSTSYNKELISVVLLQLDQTKTIEQSCSQLSSRASQMTQRRNQRHFDRRHDTVLPCPEVFLKSLSLFTAFIWLKKKKRKTQPLRWKLC